ncbi:type II toxin-antitoxin system HipA family toxin [Amycolatopsis pithecellobii]|uniref:Type II toxin-antitoxin system HipA family toxin n=1 Tax=Amycolatopsis pithecellobii TaxID=664692 RepID=A0A6N7ZAK4_9PSEU|nr:type II toxin-antitoxin system HipA family toxin [Amycolatopsis pithecellobii]MTD58774.1 type II toxin-antitoxin system HipA family toxin [Amycolatopsis pithecellobii]
MTDSDGRALLVQLQRPDAEWVDVGLLKNNYSDNWFEFLPSYWEQGGRPVLGQIFEEHGKDWKPNAHVALPRWFSHLLPEGRLRSAVAEAAHVNSVREFELLRRLGPTDLQGAVRALPIQASGLTYNVPEYWPDESDDNDNPLLKFSLAGAQLKYSIFSDGRGLTIPARGVAGNVIAKLPDGRPGFDGVPEAEYGALELARASGILTSDARLVRISDIKNLEKWVDWVGERLVLVVDRFDRAENGRRIHMEELAQIHNIPATRETAKYTSANFEIVASYVAELTGEDSVAEVIDRLVLNVLVGNGDAHLKNWAFRYLDGQNPTLSPLYDVLPTVLFVTEDDMGLNLGGTKMFAEVDLRSFDKIGKRTGFGVAQAREQARSAVERIRSNWNDLAAYLTLRNFVRLTDRLDGLPLAMLRE